MDKLGELVEQFDQHKKEYHELKDELQDLGGTLSEAETSSTDESFDMYLEGLRTVSAIKDKMERMSPVEVEEEQLYIPGINSPFYDEGAQGKVADVQHDTMIKDLHLTDKTDKSRSTKSYLTEAKNIYEGLQTIDNKQKSNIQSLKSTKCDVIENDSDISMVPESLSPTKLDTKRHQFAEPIHAETMKIETKEKDPRSRLTKSLLKGDQRGVATTALENARCYHTKAKSIIDKEEIIEYYKLAIFYFGKTRTYGQYSMPETWLMDMSNYCTSATKDAVNFIRREDRNIKKPIIQCFLEDLKDLSEAKSVCHEELGSILLDQATEKLEQEFNSNLNSALDDFEECKQNFMFVDNYNTVPMAKMNLLNDGRQLASAIQYLNKGKRFHEELMECDESQKMYLLYEAIDCFGSSLAKCNEGKWNPEEQFAVVKIYTVAESNFYLAKLYHSELKMESRSKEYFSKYEDCIRKAVAVTGSNKHINSFFKQWLVEAVQCIDDQ